MFNKIKKLLLAKEAIEQNYYDDINYINDEIQKAAAMGSKSVVVDLPNINKNYDPELKHLQTYFTNKKYMNIEVDWHSPYFGKSYYYIQLSWK